MAQKAVPGLNLTHEWKFVFWYLTWLNGVSIEPELFMKLCLKFLRRDFLVIIGLKLNFNTFMSLLVILKIKISLKTIFFCPKRAQEPRESFLMLFH